MATPARPQIDTGYFFQQIASAECSTLVLDFDTTLRTLAAPPRSVFPLPTVRELLDCIIMARRTRVVVASKRAARDVLAQLRSPYPEIWGRDGLERVPALAANTAASVSFCIHPRQQKDRFSTLLLNLCAHGPVAYVVGESRPGTAASHTFVRPEFHLSQTEASLGGTEDLVQFLIDWLRACAGEIC